MELLFRGQTRKFGEKLKNFRGDPMDSNWVFGGLCHGEGDYSIIYSYHPVEKNVVYTDTVGQYIWKNDSNGKKIFTGDILCDWKGSRYEVSADEVGARFVLIEEDGSVIGFDGVLSADFKIIGNIFDRDQEEAFYEKHK